jgi:hypothetical protein
VGILEPKLVSKAGGEFIVFASNGLAQLGPKPEPLNCSCTLAGRFTHVTGSTVNPLQQREQTAPEDSVVLGAAQPTTGPKFHEFDAAIGASQLGERADEFADVSDDQALNHGIESQVGRGLRQGQSGLARTRRTKVEFFTLAPNPLGEMNRRLVLASLTDHDLATPSDGTASTWRATGPAVTAPDPARSI